MPEQGVDEYQAMSKQPEDQREIAAKEWARQSASLESARRRLEAARQSAHEAQDAAIELALTVGRLEALAQDSENTLRRLMR